MIAIQEVSYSRRGTFATLALEQFESLLYGRDVEEDRATSMSAQLEAVAGDDAYCLTANDEDRCTVLGTDFSFDLADGDSVNRFVASLEGPVALDLTTLEHRVWAPLTRALVAANADFAALYAEPDDYRSNEGMPGAGFELSDTRGIRPLPGFARLSRRISDEGDFAALIGFEGPRLAHILDQEDVREERTHPVVGSPGFRIEYPSQSVLAHEHVFKEGRMSARLQYARASCPFEAYRVLERIHSRVGGRHLRIAPVGTKPHALGAVLYALQQPGATELVYDHPSRSRGRTYGTRGVHIYEVSAFLQSLKGPAGD